METAVVPCFVLADDGLFYRNPVIAGNGWFVEFAGDDGPTLTVAECYVGDGGPCVDERMATRYAKAALHASGVDADLLGLIGWREICEFPAHGRLGKQMHLAFAWQLSFNAPPPARLFAGKGHRFPFGGDKRVMAFGQCWG